MSVHFYRLMCVNHCIRLEMALFFARNSLSPTFLFCLQKLALNEGTPAFDVWTQPVDPVYLKIYLFHVVNPDEIAHNKAKPILKERGPFVFK